MCYDVIVIMTINISITRIIITYNDCPDLRRVDAAAGHADALAQAQRRLAPGRGDGELLLISNGSYSGSYPKIDRLNQIKYCKPCLNLEC